MLRFSSKTTNNFTPAGNLSARVALAIAGHDPSSGAGISADLQVLAAHGIFAATCVTALTVQSTQGVAAVHPVSPEYIRHTLQHLAEDLPVEGVKMGMLSNAENVQAIASFLTTLRRNRLISIVLDPVLKSSSGAELLSPAAISTLCSELLPLVDWITPNRSELAALTGLPVASISQVRAASEALASRYPDLYVVVTGGDEAVPTDFLRLPEGTFHTFVGDRVETTSTHGTGCAFSSALLANLMQGRPPIDAVSAAKTYVSEALRRAPGLGQGRGPLNLLWPLQKIHNHED